VSLSRLKSRTLLASVVEPFGVLANFEGDVSGVLIFNKPVQAVNVKKVLASISRVRVFNLFLFKSGAGGRLDIFV
jgi:hypothetical protein